MFYYRVTGQWCAAAHSTAQTLDWLGRYAEALGVEVGAIEEVESEYDPREGVLLVEPPPPPAPDVNGFLMAAMSALGLARGNALLAAWPTFTVALGAANWTVARTVIDAATQAGSVTSDERATLLALLTEHGIPE